MTLQPALSHADLGPLRYDDSLGWYEGSATLASEKLLVYLSAESEEEAALSLAAAASCWSSLSAFVTSGKMFAATALLDLKNAEWAEEGGAPISDRQFAERLVSESIVFYPDGTVELAFHDGGLFSGHSVQVSATADGSFTDASIAG